MRRGERIAGVLAALLGVLGLGYALLGPTVTYSQTAVTATGGRTTTTGTTNLLEWQGVPPFLVIMLVLVVGVAVAADRHVRQPTRRNLALLWVLSLLVLGGTLLSMLSIGLFLIPAALAALLTAVLGARAGAEASSLDA